MRIPLYALMFLCSCQLFAIDVNIKVIPLDGKPAYLVQVGPVQEGLAATKLQQELTDSFHQPIRKIRNEDKREELLEIGPLSDYTLARELQNKISLQSPPESQLPAVPQVAPPSKPLSREYEENSAQKIWNLRNADVRAVIAEVSRVTGKNFIIDPRVQGKVSIVSSTPMSDKELYQVFLSMLQVSGYAAIPSGDITKIVPNIDAKTMSTDLLSQMKNPPIGDDMMVQVIPVHYVPSEQLVPVLRPLMPQWSNVSAYGPSNMLILSGRASNIKQLANIIKQVDNSSANGIDIVPLKRALAMDVVNTLKDLVKTQPGVGSHAQTTLAADDRSNSILLSGNKTERIRLRLIISQLDRKNSGGQNSNTQVIYLNYLRAEDAVPILAGIAQASFSGNVGTTIGTITRPELDSTNPASNMASLTGGNPSAAPANAAGQMSGVMPNTSAANTQNEGGTKPTVQIIAEPNTNSIIINAPATLIRTLKSVISQLDIKPAQLLIEALVTEINEADFNTLGIEWGSLNQKTLAPESFRPGFAIINSKTAIDQFQAQIYALARLHKANILSTPSVVVLDNRQAKILIGKQVSIAASSYPNNGNGTAPSGSPFTTFDRVNVALHLYVRPQITRGRGIQMQIDQGNDTLDNPDPVNPGTTPTFNISSIVTSVHVESGDIIVLGGLAQDSLANDDNGIPILEDIPGLGRLFQRKITNREKKVLMVFIRPRILRTERDGFEVTGAKYNDLRHYQLDWLRTQDYNHKNNATLLRPLRTAVLPRPFMNQPNTITTK
jgi:general secretion pathway protein D